MLNLLCFMERFSTESACEEDLVQLRWKEGFQSPKCKATQFMLARVVRRRDADKRVPLFECKSCHRQTSITLIPSSLIAILTAH